MFSIDVNHNATRIYQELVTKVPRRRSIHNPDNSALSFASQPSKQVDSILNNTRPQQDTLQTRSRFLSGQLLNRENIPRKDLQISTARLNHTLVKTKHVPTKRHSLLSQVADANHQKSLSSHTPKRNDSRTIPKCFEPMTSYLVNDLATKKKTASSRTIYVRTRRGESLAMRVLRVSELYPQTRERVSSQTLMYVIQGAVMTGGQVLSVGDCKRLSPLSRMELNAQRGRDALVLVIADALNTYASV